MAWIILGTTCYISGEAFSASPNPIQVSEPDAKALISMGHAKPADAPLPMASKPNKKTSNPIASEP